jgi:hypothetical protein
MDEKTKAIKVTVIEQNQKTALVEWKAKAGLRRVTIPASEVKSGSVDELVLEAGIEYGIPWEKLTSISVTPSMLAEGLRTAGLWTGEDLYRNQKKAIGVINAMLSIELSKLLQIAADYQGGK